MDELQSLFASEPSSMSKPGFDREPPSYVVGIIASVGQLETLLLLLDAMPVDSGMAFVIIYQSLGDVTGKILSRHTEMSTYDAADKMVVERNSVYLIPPRKEMMIAGGRLLPIESDPDEGSKPLVETFFRSLAEDARERAIGVVLLETLRDGSEGVLAIGEAGGLVIALEETEEIEATPDAPFGTGLIDFLVPPSKLAETLLKHAHYRSVPSRATHRLGDSQLFKEIAPQGSKGNPSERALPAATAQLTEVLNAATQVLICATDIHGTITLFNSGAENMLGYKSSEMVGKKTPDIMHLKTEVEKRGEELSRELGRDVNGFEVFVAHAKEGRYERREWTYVRKNGRHLTVNLVVTAVRNHSGEITGFLGVAEDISERKRSEEALRKSEERFDLAVAGSNNGLWDWDVHTNEVYYSRRFKELLGYGEDEFEHTFSSFETHLHPDDRERTLAAVRHHLTDREAYDIEYRLRTKFGRYRWFRALGQAVWDDGGRALRMAGSLTDVTTRKQAEVALKRYAAEIQRANDTLRTAESNARKAVVERDQFLAMLSHELRNPLSSILHGVGVLNHADADPADTVRALQAIRGQAHHMSKLLDDLLDVARITQGKIGFQRQVLDLNVLIREAVQAVQPAVESRRQRLSVMPARGPVMVEGDPTRLLQIVENLLTNASKYSPTGGDVTLELKNGADECMLCVRDNGRGISPDMLDEIFDIFFQSNKALDRSDGGMGVGLTLVRTLVEMHDGTVTAHSDGLGHGSKFVIRLPLTSKLPAKSKEETLATTANVIRVLLVEDNFDSREMLRAILTLYGFRVDVAEDGQQGLEAILTERPDVALIDIGLPKLDGYEVARQVRKQLDRSKVRLVALTGYGQAKDREAAFQAGFDEHLVKPVDPKDLARLLRETRPATSSRTRSHLET